MKYNPQIVIAYFKECGLPAPITEHKFHDVRKWRFDFCWPEQKLALEVEGGIFVGGRHGRGAGMKKDMEKYNAACVLGWRVLRVIPQDLCMQETVDMLRECLKGKK